MNEPRRGNVAERRDRSDVDSATAAAREAGAAFARTRAPAELKRAISAYRELVDALDEEEAEHGTAVMDLCSLLGNDWALTGSENAWREAVAFVESWRQRVPPPDWRAALYILAHGLLLFRRAAATETSADIAEAIATLEAARSRVRTGSGVHGTSSTRLSDLRLRRYLANRDPFDLEASIQDAAAVFASDRARDEEKLLATKTFAKAALVRAELLGSDADLDAAIEAAKYALERTDDPEHRGDLHGVRASALRRRYDWHGERADLEAAIASYEQALGTRDLPAEVEASRLDDIGNGYASLYEITLAPKDLDKAIDHSRRALKLLPKIPARAGACANLAISLVDRGREQRDRVVLDEAAAAAREGLAVPDLHPMVTARLHLALADALRVGDVLIGSDENLDKVIEAQEAAMAAVLAGEADDPVQYRLAARSRATDVARRLVASLLRRASLGTTPGGPDLKRALAVGEAGKSVLLAQELLRRALPPPAGVDERSLSWEAELLARLAALDAHELAPAAETSPARMLLRIRKRSRIRAALDRLWDEMAIRGPAAARYVAMRRDVLAVLLDVLASPPPGIMLLSFAETDDVDVDGRRQRGLCLFVLRPDQSEPEVAFTAAGRPLAAARERFVAEVPVDRGRGNVNETWWQELATLLRREEPLPDVAAVLSPVGQGADLPWQLVLERSGWVHADGKPMPLVVVPSLALVAAGEPHGVDAWHEVKDDTARPGVPAEVAQSVLFLKRVSTRPSTGPLVIGDPGGDLESASGEAATVAAILGVEPLLGAEATVDAVRHGFATAEVVHVAAHARFSPGDPLDSVIALADGDLSAHDLVGMWNTADIVVLSACESGSGVPVLGGEVLGFATALLRSGVKTVMASLWSVDDAATAYMMQQFYAAMVQFYAAMVEGVPAANALVAAATAVRSQPGWAPPYYWAGFVVYQRGLVSSEQTEVN
jgi:tetratricopeptide (TPR) repeat protein